jgi:hypothetical protein
VEVRQFTVERFGKLQDLLSAVPRGLPQPERFSTQ